MDIFLQTTILRMMDDPNGVINRRCNKKGDGALKKPRLLLRRESGEGGLYM
jgi:hypothetical protein